MATQVTHRMRVEALVHVEQYAIIELHILQVLLEMSPYVETQERQRQFVRLQMPREFVESNTEQPAIAVALHVKLQKSHCLVELFSL